MTLADVQNRTDLGKPYLSELERGKRSPGAGSLFRLSRALGVTIDWIVKGEEAP